MLPIDFPPDLGLIEFDVPAAPVSFQASRAKKAAITTAIQNLVAPSRYLLSGDVKMTIRWSISERSRYESDSAADVDNIVKPILDALSGPDGIMVDDCQVQELTCYWSGGYSNPEAETLTVEMKFNPDDYLLKAGLSFLHIEKGLYFPIYDDLPPDLVLHSAEDIVRRFNLPREMVDRGMDAAAARLTLPIQRVFHKSKIGGFRITTIDELRSRFGEAE